MDDDGFDWVQVELEALQATHGQCAQLLEPRCIAVQLAPHTADDVSTRFVQCTLVFRLPEGYPAAATSSSGIALKDGRGLGDAREQQLLQLLKAEAQQMSGELVLGHLCEVGRGMQGGRGQERGRQGN